MIVLHKAQDSAMLPSSDLDLALEIKTEARQSLSSKRVSGKETRRMHAHLSQAVNDGTS